MTSLINRVVKENTAEYINSNPQVQQIKAEIKSDLNIEPDKVEISEENKKPKKRGRIIGGILAVGGLIGTAVSLAVMIGKNPAKAAKVLEGHTKYGHKAYEEAEKLAAELFAKEKAAPKKSNIVSDLFSGKKEGYEIGTEDLLKVFEKPEFKSELSCDIEFLEKHLAKNNISENSEVFKALKSLKQNLQAHLSSVEQKLLNGEKFENTALSEKFKSENARNIEEIQKYIKDANDIDLIGLFNSSYIYKINLNDYIKECPRDVLPNDGIFFHGTKKAKLVYENGFSPFASNQIDQFGRELGAGVYTTPDIRVAAAFSGLHGDIIPVKLADDAKIALVTGSVQQELYGRIVKFISERLTVDGYNALAPDVKSALMESVMRHVFKQAGYDAAYMPKAYKAYTGIDIAAILSPDVNEMIGRNQKQLVIFSPEKTKIVSRTFTERVNDLADKFRTFKDMFVYGFKNPSLF